MPVMPISRAWLPCGVAAPSTPNWLLHAPYRHLAQHLGQHALVEEAAIGQEILHMRGNTSGEYNRARTTAIAASPARPPSQAQNTCSVSTASVFSPLRAAPISASVLVHTG